MDRPVRLARRRRDHGREASRFANLASGDGRRAAGQEVSTADRTVERAADKLQQAAEKVAARGGLSAKLAEPLAEDAAFLRKLKPSLIVARAKGQAPTNQKPGVGVVVPSGPQLGARPTPARDGPNPFVVVGAALAAGILFAKVIDWRGHAHPRR